MALRAYKSPSFLAGRRMKVAIVHYWLVSMRGGERVIEALCDIFPEADLFCLVADRERISTTLSSRKIVTSFLQKIGGKKHYQKMLPLMPFALEALDLTDYDLVISSESGPAKGVITRPDAVHICYCHSPMRYIWDLYPQYYRSMGGLGRAMMATFAPLLRTWDVTTAARVDHFVANSDYVAKRIKKFYRRDSQVINPPVDLSRFSIAEQPGDYYLCAGQVTPYKRIDLAVDACTRTNRKLLVVGDGVTEELRRRAGPSITFAGRASDQEMAEHIRRCRALIFPGLEDFGIVPLEAMACGKPVIAYGKGGALETIIPSVTGLHFAEQTVEGLIECLAAFESDEGSFSPMTIRAHAETFSLASFRRRFTDFVQDKLEKSAA